MSFPAETKLDRLVQEFNGSVRDYLAQGMPWITEGAKAWCTANIGHTDKVLEFGAGRSTIFWASRAERVTVVEGSPDWTMYLLMYLYTNPSLMKRVRLYFSPAEWNSTLKGDPVFKRYWGENRSSLCISDISALERDLIRPVFKGHNVVLFDGNIRNKMFIRHMAEIDFDEVEVIIIDNTESVSALYLAEAIMPKRYKRMDFVACNMDKTEIPAHQKGKHITSIYVTEDRLSRSAPVKVEQGPFFSLDDLKQHMRYSREDEIAVDSSIKVIIEQINEMLGTEISEDALRLRY